MTANPSLERTSGAWARCGGLSMRVCAPGQARPLTSNVGRHLTPSHSPFTTETCMKLAVCMFAIGPMIAVILGCTPSPEPHNKEIARRVFSEVLSDGRFDRAAELYSPDFINHGSHRNVGLKEDQDAARGWKQAFPDLVITPEKVIAEGDLVTVYWVARGTNSGAGNGLPATGKSMEASGITIWRIVGGRITDEWSAFDQLSILQQLGLTPTGAP
jgi:steroid delta-isomerase-like uncharacterized protein